MQEMDFVRKNSRDGPMQEIDFVNKIQKRCFCSLRHIVVTLTYKRCLHHIAISLIYQYTIGTFQMMRAHHFRKGLAAPLKVRHHARYQFTFTKSDKSLPHVVYGKPLNKSYHYMTERSLHQTGLDTKIRYRRLSICCALIIFQRD